MMTYFSKRHRDRAMRIICGHYVSGTELEIDAEYLHKCGLPKSIDAEQLAYVLEGMGYIELTRYYEGPPTIRLTNDGRCYFERKADKLHEKRVENIRYIITTAIAVLALVLAGISLAAQLGLIQLPVT